ncbi:RNA methyltransferase [Allobranchiibius sp. CTAmp26]|uniref:TrmH family RNA methyltransferase n=1 Tax=Allobranchiibius sp. CTAmp26 TaxID=2815214 RepID=UPI001AA0DB3C|nr:RNA methyltransferase [Allobranchiibius sp. CTAmp26]MBO1754857.1 RNA methyltransferase [Allobranchiibius sp. CTAmp26]
MSELLITSPSNPRLKDVVALRKRRRRDDLGLTLIEGYDELRLALDAGVAPRQLLYCPELASAGTEVAQLVREADERGAQIARLNRVAFEKIAYREGADGFVAVVALAGAALTDVATEDDSLILLAEGVEKPGNLGAMLRTADAAGVDAVVSADPVTDWGNPNVVRASKGTVFAVPVATAPTEETLAWLRARGVRLVAATPDTRTSYTDVDLTGAVAIAVGTEKQGLTDQVLDAADERVAIPMSGTANSLNVATSAAILLYEAVRQRRSATVHTPG